MTIFGYSLNPPPLIILRSFTTESSFSGTMRLFQNSILLKFFQKIDLWCSSWGKWEFRVSCASFGVFLAHRN